MARQRPASRPKCVHLVLGRRRLKVLAEAVVDDTLPRAAALLLSLARPDHLVERLSPDAHAGEATLPVAAIARAITGRSGRCTFATLSQTGFRSLRTKCQPPRKRGWSRSLGPRWSARPAVRGGAPAGTRRWAGLDLVGDPGEALGFDLGVNRAPGLDELARWVELQHIAVKNPGRRDRRRAVRYGRASSMVWDPRGNQRGDDRPRLLFVAYDRQQPSTRVSVQPTCAWRS